MNTFQYQTIDLTITSKRNSQIPATISIPTGVENPPFLMAIHGFSSSRHEFGLYDALAQMLAQHGVLVARVDFPGNGDSIEPFSQYSFSSMEDDIDATIDYVCHNYGCCRSNMALQGYSMGGRMACLYSAKHTVKGLSLWAPALTPGSTMIANFCGDGEKKILAMKTAFRNGMFPVNMCENDEDTYDFSGAYDFSGTFLRELLTHSHYAALNKFSGNFFIAYGMQDETVPHIDIETAITLVENAKTYEVLPLEGCDHDLGTGWGTDWGGGDTPEIYDKLLIATANFLLRSFNLNSSIERAPKVTLVALPEK